jgi:hypothetical protein
MGTPSPGWDSLVRQASVAARRRKRRRRQRRMLWLLTAATTAVLVVIAVFIMDISKVSTKVRPAALSASTRTVSHPSGSATAHGAKPARHTQHAVTYPQVTDVSSGLSYRMLGAPWRRGCPSNLNTFAFDWTGGENTVAGHVSIGGSVIDWHGLACSGPLQQQFPYGGPADLESTAISLVSALDPAYYAGVQHTRLTEASSAMQVSGHQSWKIEFAMNYTDGASQGLTWSTELGAVVVVDRGAGQFPAVFYVSVPASLGTQNVATFLSSLRVS